MAGPEDEMAKQEPVIKFLDQMDAAITAGAIVDFMMPNGKRFGNCTGHELGEFGIYRDTVERAFDADVTKGLYLFEGDLYFGVTGTSQIYTVQRRDASRSRRQDAA
jgi:hypothetical protein